MPIFTALFTGIAAIAGSVSTFFAGLGAFGSALLKIGLSIGLNLLSQALAGKPKPPGFSVQGRLQSGGDLPRSFLLGNCATAGSLVYANGWGDAGGAPNGYLTQVIALSDKPVSGINNLWVNGEKVTVLWAEPDDDGMGFPVEEYRKDGKDHLWINFYDGTQTAADPFMVSTVSRPEDGREYGADRIGYGMAYAIMHARVHDELWTGFPNFKFELRGLALYDISQDTTAGGDGDQRWDDPSTWGGPGDLLPAVQLYNILRGITDYGGGWLYGLQGLTAARLPAGNWIAAIGKCSLEIAGPEGSGVEPQYRAGGEIQVGAELAVAIEALLTTCAGRLTEVGGVYTMHAGAADAAAFVIEDGDILSTEEQTFTPFFGLDQTINGISVRYPNPAEGFNIKVAPPLYRTDLEELDGGRRLMADVSLDLVPYAWQAQRLQRSTLEEARRFRRHTIVLPPKFWSAAVPNAYFEWGSARNGYVTKLFRIDGAIDKSNCDVIVDCTEVDPADYDPDFGDYVPPIDVPPVIVRPSPQVIVDWYAVGVILEGDDGSQRPGIQLSWDGDQDDINGVEWEVRLDGDESGELVHNGGTSHYEVGTAIITQALIRATAYEVRGRYVSNSGRAQSWSAWLDVTTPDVAIVTVPGDILDGLIDRAKLSAAFRSALDEVSQTIMRVRGELQATIDELAAMAATTDSQVYSSVTLVKIANANAFVAIKHEETARVDADSAIYTSIDAVVASVTDIDTDLTALGAIVTTQGIAITTNAGGISSLVTVTNALDARITDAEGDILSQASLITAQTVRTDVLYTSAIANPTAVTASTITLAVGSSSITNYYNGLPITIRSGVGVGQTRVISAYNGTTRVATLLTNWDVTPNTSSQYALGNATSAFAMSELVTSVSTTVGGHTSSISVLQASYNGLAAQYGILFDLDGSTGGALLTGFTALDNSVEFEAIFSVDRMTIANLQNLVKNWIFDANGATVNVASIYDIKRWAVTSGVAQVDVVANSDNGSNLATPYCLKLALSSAFLVHTDEDPAATNGALKGFAVTDGQKFKLRFQAIADASTRNIEVALRVRNSAGTVSTADSEVVGITLTGGGAYYEVELTANVSGRGYIRFGRSSTSGVVWLTQVELMRMNASMLIVDGTIAANHMAANSITAANGAIEDLAVSTIKIAGAAVTVPYFFRDGLTDNNGAGVGASFQTSMEEFYAVYVPSGDVFSVSAQIVCQMTGSSGAFEHKVSIKMNVGGSYVDVDNNGGDVIPSASLIGGTTFTSPGSGVIYIYVRHQWRGDVGITAQSRSCISMTVKR